MFETAKDIPTFEQRLAKGAYDFAYMSPYTYTVLHRSRAGYTAFAKEKDKKLTGIIVVRRDSEYQDIKDLRGKHEPADPGRRHPRMGEKPAVGPRRARPTAIGTPAERQSVSARAATVCGPVSVRDSATIGASPQRTSMRNVARSRMKSAIGGLTR